MIRDKITRWVPLVTIVICGLLIAGVVVAQPGGWGGGHDRMGPGMGSGPPDRHGMGKGPGAMMFLGPGGLFADEEIHNLMVEIRILGFINKFEFTAEQLEQIASLSVEARDATSEIAEQAKGLKLDRLHDRRDALLRGERPDEFKRPEEPMIPEGMKEQAEETKEILQGITEEFLNLLTDEQREMLKENHRPHFGTGPGGFGPKGHGGPGMHRGAFDDDEKEEFMKPEAEMPDEFKKPEMGNPGGDSPREFKDRPFRDREWGEHKREFRGEHGGPGTGFGGGMKRNPEMMFRIKIIEILLNPQTVDIIHEKMNYL